MKTPPLALVTSALLAFALGMTATASAQSAPPGASASTAANSAGIPSFGSLDKKHRGYLTRSDIPKDAEGMEQLRAHFRETDTDHNSRLSPTEYAAYVQSQTPTSEQKPGQSQH